MKHMAKKLLILVMAVALTAALAGCDLLNFGDNMIKDSQVYVQGVLDKLYLAQYNQEYLDLMGVTEEEAQEDYEDWLSQEIDWFLSYWEIEDQDDALLASIEALYKEIYSQAKYTVNPTTKMENGDYSVLVDVEPMNIMTLVTGDDMQVAYEEVGGDELAYGYKIVELLQAQLPNMGYEPAKSIGFKLTEDASGDYTLVEQGIQDFDMAIIIYN